MTFLEFVVINTSLIDQAYLSNLNWAISIQTFFVVELIIDLEPLFMDFGLLKIASVWRTPFHYYLWDFLSFWFSFFRLFWLWFLLWFGRFTPSFWWLWCFDWLRSDLFFYSFQRFFLWHCAWRGCFIFDGDLFLICQFVRSLRSCKTFFLILLTQWNRPRNYTFHHWTQIVLTWLLTHFLLCFYLFFRTGFSDLYFFNRFCLCFRFLEWFSAILLEFF